MKGDVATDVRCPICPWVGHPRTSTVHVGRRHPYNQAPETIARHSIYQHLANEHPSLSPRQRSLLVQLATRGTLPDGWERDLRELPGLRI